MKSLKPLRPLKPLKSLRPPLKPLKSLKPLKPRKRLQAFDSLDPWKCLNRRPEWDAALTTARRSINGSLAMGIGKHPVEVWDAVETIKRYMKRNKYHTFLIGTDLLGTAYAFRNKV